MFSRFYSFLYKNPAKAISFFPEGTASVVSSVPFPRNFKLTKDTYQHRVRKVEAQRHLPGTLEEVLARMLDASSETRAGRCAPAWALPRGAPETGLWGTRTIDHRDPPIPRPGCWAWGTEAPSPPLSLHPVLRPPVHKEPLRGQVAALRDPLGGPVTEPGVAYKFKVPASAETGDKPGR